MEQQKSDHLPLQKKYILINAAFLNEQAFASAASSQVPLFIEKFIREGQSTTVAFAATSHSVLASALSFEDNELATTLQQQQISAEIAQSQEYHISFLDNVRKNLAAEDFDEDMNEINFVEKPKFFAEISNNLQTILLTDNINNATFARNSKLDFYYNKNLAIDSKIVRQYIQSESEKTLFIFDFQQYRLDIEDKIIRELFEGVFDLKSCCVRVLLSPIGQTQQQIIGKLYLTQSNLSSQDILQIIPRQTLQFRKGEFVGSEQQYNYFVSVFYENSHNRTDSVQTLSDYLTQEGLKKISNGVIHCSALFREILFKLGRLPKFGA